MDFGKFLESLKHLPLTLLAALSAAGLFVLYAPHIPGMDMSAARKWGWIAPATLFAVILFVFRFIDEVLQSYVRVTAHNPQRTLSLTVHSQKNTTWWCHGPTNTQMVANISAYNPTAANVRMTAARLIEPRIPTMEMEPIMFMVADTGHGRGGSRNDPIPAHHNGTIHLTMLAKRRVGKEGGFIHAVVGLTEQNGYEHKVKVRLWPMPTPTSPPTSTSVGG